MALVAFSASRSGPHDDLQPFERLALQLSSTFSTLDADDADGCVSHALEAIGKICGVDECTLIAFGERGVARVAGSWASTPHLPCGDDDLLGMPWLLHRLSRNAVVATTPSTELPHAAATDRAHATRTGIAARLAVPVALAGRVGYGLMIGSRERHTEWRGPIIERLRLLGEIVGGGLERVRQNELLRASQSDDRYESGRAEVLYLREEARNQAEADQIVGSSPALRMALERLGQVAPLDATVLLLGETGTGKELFARAVHERSRRRDRPFVKVNCAALPASLIESELFGHERGAFTGAIAQRVGRFEMADRGTILLDEVGDLAPELQAKLLRILQEGEFERVGSSKVKRVDVRVIAATHMDLEQAVAEGRFRADLYYRLSVFPITLPALRQRPEDIPQLVWFFIHRLQREMNRRISHVPAPVMRALQQHEWPGNVRELENVIERAMIRTSGDTLQLDDPLRAAPRLEAAPCGDTLDAVQRYHIEKILRQCNWRINGAGNAAVRLGLHPNTLRFRIRKLGVVIPDRRGGTSVGAS